MVNGNILPYVQAAQYIEDSFFYSIGKFLALLKNLNKYSIGY